MNLRSILAIFLVSIITWHMPHCVWGVGKGTMRVSPAYIEIDAQDQTTKDTQFAVTYTNTSIHQIHVDLSFLPVAFAGDEAKMNFPITQSILIAHIIPSNTSFDVASGETKTIILSMKDLELLSDADYYEALVARVTPNEVNQKTAAGIVGNITTLLFVRKNSEGRYPMYTVAKASHILPGVLFQYPDTVPLSIGNKGKTYGVPRGIVKITDMVGRVVRQGGINIDSTRIFPGTSHTLVVPLLGDSVLLPFHIGYIDIHVYDQYAKKVESAYSTRQYFAYVDPLFGSSLGIVLLVCVIFFVYAQARQQKRAQRHMDTTPKTHAP